MEVDNVKHSYGAGSNVLLPFGRPETVGFIYTCSGGFMDLGHIGDLIDLTRWYYDKLRAKNHSGDTIPLALAPAGSNVVLKANVAAADRMRVARSIAFDQGVYHEIESYWIHTLGEHHSAFSPEDLPSNFLGTYIAEQAITAGGDFDTAAGAAARSLFTTLGALNAAGTTAAFTAAGALWFSGNAMDDAYLKRRNLDVSPITPWLVTIAVCPSTTWPVAIPKQLPAGTQAFYETTFAVAPDAQAGMGGVATIKNTDFGAQIARIRPDAQARYGPRYDQST